MELITRTGKTPEPHAFETVVDLQVSEAPLDALALVTRLEESLCPHQLACRIAGVLVNVARDLSRRHVRTALHLEHADIAVELGGAIAKHVALMYGPGGVQHLVVRADVNTSLPIPAKVAARESTIVALAGIAYRDVRRDPTADQPAEETASPISGVGREPLRFQAEAPLGASEHRLCGLNLVIGARRCRLDINNDRVLDIDEIIEPIPELHPFVGFCGPC